MASLWSSSYSAPSSSSGSWNYDVFLSFRGEDTRKTFVDHLYLALNQRLIRTYKDDITLGRGESIGPSLLKAIEESRIAVIIFSENYADSSWCLDELAYIMKCRDEKGQIVMPIFYDVDPSEVRNQKSKFGEAFAKQEVKNVTKAELWRKALVDAGNIAGWEPKLIANGHESKAIIEIVDKIFDRLFSLHSDVDEELVGMRDRLQDLKSQLEIGLGGVRMLGIWGVGGGGKTTLATSIYMVISHNFESHCIVDNIREESRKLGLKALQEKILSSVLKTQVRVQSVEEGKHMIRSRLSRNNVLILLDDVDDRKQLEALAGSHKWFGSGSRIIITTRDEHLLRTHKVDQVCPVKLLSRDEAIQLFYKHAYNEEVPVKDYETLSLRVVSYAAGLPLALKVLGSFLYDRDEKEWMSTLARLEDNPEMEIVEKLKISFDGLKTVEKELFLDIACFFRGKSAKSTDDAIEILEACGYHPGIGITVLRQKALITIVDDRFDMHDLVQEMGHYIVRGENPNNPEKHSRVWKHEEINNMCFGDATTENDMVEAIRYHASGHDHSARFCKIVSNMKKLRWLIVYTCLNDGYAEGPYFLSNELQYIYWMRYSTSLFPDSFQPMKLVVLKLVDSLQKELWKGYKRLPCLKVLELNSMHNLLSTPDFDGLPCLQELTLSFCDELEEIHPSLGNHTSLEYIRVVYCPKLRMFPTIVQMEKLNTLEIAHCKEIVEFPEIQVNMESLVKLSLGSIGIEVLPSSIGECCTNLISLDLYFFSNLKSVEFNLDSLKHLKEFQCQVEKMPPQSFEMVVHQLTHSLRKLDIGRCGLEDGQIPHVIVELSNLVELDLGGNDFTRLDFSLSQLTRLKVLNLIACRRLVELPELPSTLAILRADFCKSLTTVGDSTTNCRWLCQVSLVHSIVSDGGRLLQSMLQGNAIESQSMILQMKGLEIAKGFTPPLLRGGRYILQLPENWYNDFCGFLMCSVYTFYFGFSSHPRISMKQVISDMDSQHDVVWEESDSDRFNITWLGYVSFDSLRRTSWWDQTYNVLSFSFDDEKDSGFGVRLVARKSGSSPTETSTDSSEFSDYTPQFKVLHDSAYALHIELVTR